MKMKTHLTIAFLFSLFSVGSFEMICVAQDLMELPLQIVIQHEMDPLTTDQVVRLDAGSLNPHRKRWAISRSVKLLGLEAVENPKEPSRYGVRVNGISALIEIHLRGEGPWFQTIEEFDCSWTVEDIEKFSTLEGAKKTAETAAQKYEDVIKNNKGRLNVALEKISGSTPEIAKVMAEYLFDQWKREIEIIWKRTELPTVQQSEWAGYLKASKEKGICDKKKSASSFSWATIMESPKENNPPPKMLGRAPARRWNGLFSVRVSLQSGSQIVNGQFLVDSGAPVSLVSPDWLKAQGVQLPTIEIPLVPPEKVNWLGAGHAGLARRVKFEKGDVGGFPLPIKEFLAFETNFFSPPEHLSNCCDGVLGTDFLSQVVTEWIPGSPSEIKIWNLSLFRPEKMSQFFWVEASVNKRGLLESEDCFASQGRMSYSPLSWDTGNDDAVLLYGKGIDKGIASVSCGKNKLDSGRTPVTLFGEDSKEEISAGAGMDFLGRSKFILDLPHGRIWFQKGLEALPFAKNKSGLHFKFGYLKGDRSVQISKIDEDSPAADLRKLGLKEGMVVLELDSISMVEMDSWEVEQRLAGVYGDTVTVKWDNKGVIKVAPLSVK